MCIFVWWTKGCNTSWYNFLRTGKTPLLGPHPNFGFRTNPGKVFLCVECCLSCRPQIRDNEYSSWCIMYVFQSKKVQSSVFYSLFQEEGGEIGFYYKIECCSYYFLMVLLSLFLECSQLWCCYISSQKPLMIKWDHCNGRSIHGLKRWSEKLAVQIVRENLSFGTLTQRCSDPKESWPWRPSCRARIGLELAHPFRHCVCCSYPYSIRNYVQVSRQKI